MAHRDQRQDLGASDRGWRLLMGLSYGARATVTIGLAIIAASVGCGRGAAPRSLTRGR
jgi:ABC-type dipeptide/oligopeptide/nickel transport system permease subunit